jgi:hypothetical protein
VGDNVTRIMFSGKFSEKYGGKVTEMTGKEIGGRGSKFYRISAFKPRLTLLHTGGGF